MPWIFRSHYIDLLIIPFKFLGHQLCQRHIFKNIHIDLDRKYHSRGELEYFGYKNIKKIYCCFPANLRVRYIY